MNSRFGGRSENDYVCNLQKCGLASEVGEKADFILLWKVEGYIDSQLVISILFQNKIVSEIQT